MSRRRRSGEPSHAVLHVFLVAFTLLTLYPLLLVLTIGIVSNVMPARVMAARTAGIPVEGICLYPIIDHVGWDNDPDCPSGLLENRFRDGARPVHQPLADAIDRFSRNNGFAAVPDHEQIRAAE